MKNMHYSNIYITMNMNMSTTTNMMTMQMMTTMMMCTTMMTTTENTMFKSNNLINFSIAPYSDPIKDIMN